MEPGSAPDLELDEAQNQRSFQLRRSIVEHEDRQIESRLSSLLVANSFLVTAVTILLANAYNGREPEAFFWISILIAGVSVSLSILTESGIVGARLAQSIAAGRGGQIEKVAPLGGPNEEAWRACVHLDAGSRFRGSFLAAHWFGKATVLAWLGLLHYSVRKIYGYDVATVSTTCAFVGIFAFLFAIYGRGQRMQREQGR